MRSVALIWQVLADFTRSFPLVQRLADQTETQLNEAFLTAWWPPSLGPLPQRAHAVALMRLVVHMQSPADRAAVCAGWEALPAAARGTLATEMARTGIAGQSYTSTPAAIPSVAAGAKAAAYDGSATGDAAGGGAGGARDGAYGCAFLLYYAPAFARGCASAEEVVGALAILAEVYRAARALWPVRMAPGMAPECASSAP